MTNSNVVEPTTETSPRLRSRFVAGYYLLTILTGAFVLLFNGRMAFAADLVVGIVYLVVTAFLYGFTAQASNRKTR